MLSLVYRGEVMRGYLRFGLVALAMLQAGTASAGVYADDLSKCLVGKSSSADKIAFVRWFFASLGASDSTKDLSVLTSQQRLDHHKKVAALYERLLLSDCRSEAVKVVKYEGPNALVSSFETLGAVATRDLLSDPAVNREMERLGELFDVSKLQDLFDEAGIPRPAASK